MIKTLVAAAAASAVALGILAAAPAQAATGTWNGKFVSAGSYCTAGATGCKLKIHVGELDCRPFIGADVNRCINENTTHDYRYPVVWRSAQVRYCTAYGVADKAWIAGTGNIAKLNGAKVTVSYGSTSDYKTDFVRCN